MLLSIFAIMALFYVIIFCFTSTGVHFNHRDNDDSNNINNYCSIGNVYRAIVLKNCWIFCPKFCSISEQCAGGLPQC